MGVAAKERLTKKLTANTKEAKRFRDMVDAELGGTSHYAFAPWFASLLGALTSDPKYCAFAVAKTDAEVASEEALIAQGKKAAVSGDSYLEVGGVIGGLAMVYDHCFADLTSAQKTRWVAYAEQAVWNVWHPSEAKWGTTTFPWSGWSIDNPFNNYHYSFLRATMLLGLATAGDSPSGQGNVDLFRETKLPILISAFEKDLQGGGSREGTGYGTSHKSLFELYDFWEATTGETVWNLTSHTRASLPNFIHATVPTMDRIAPIGDHARDSTASFFDYHREQVLVLQHLLGKDDPLTDVAQTFLEGVSVKEMGQAFEYVWDFLYAEPSHAKAPLSKLPKTFHGTGTGVTYFRSGWTADATWGALIAGPYTESHAHHDQGSLLFYKSAWLAADELLETHSGIVQEEELHNLVRLVKGGKILRMQAEKSPGVTTALHDEARHLYWAGSMGALYGDPSVTRVEREVVFLREAETYVVFDRVEVAGGTSVYTLNAPKKPALVGARWTVDGPGGGLELLPLAPAGLVGTVVDWKTVDADFLGGFRLDLPSTGSARYLTVLAPTGKVTTATPSTAGGLQVVDLAFTGGATAKVSFSVDGSGGHLVLSGAPAVDVELAAGVVVPPFML